MNGAARWESSYCCGVVHSQQSITKKNDCIKHPRTHGEKDDRRKFRKDEFLMLKIINLKNTRQAGRKRK